MAGVILDAGHGGYDNGAQYDGRKEKDDNLRLTLAVGQILEQNGVPVSYTRQSDIYQSPSEKARLGNESGADYFISFHRNASPNANEQYVLNRAVADGYEGNIVYKDPYYAVQIGEYNTLDEAVRLENELKKKGYDTLVIKE